MRDVQVGVSWGLSALSPLPCGLLREAESPVETGVGQALPAEELDTVFPLTTPT